MPLYQKTYGDTELTTVQSPSVLETVVIITGDTEPTLTTHDVSAAKFSVKGDSLPIPNANVNPLEIAGGGLVFNELSSAPSVGGATKGLIYLKDDGGLYFVDQSSTSYPIITPGAEESWHPLDGDTGLWYEGPVVIGDSTAGSYGAGDLYVKNGIYSSELTGTLQTAAQTNITSVGTLTNITTSGSLYMTDTATATGISMDYSSGITDYLKRITWNDGGGNFNFRAGHKYSGGEVYVNTASAGAVNLEWDTDGGEGIFRIQVADAGTNGDPITWGNDFVVYHDKITSKSDILPLTDSTYNLGSSTGPLYWANIYADNLYGTLQTAAQGNITSVGTLATLTVTATITGSVSGSAGSVVASLSKGNGMAAMTSYNGSTARTMTLGTPTTCTDATSNAVTATSHTHDISYAGSALTGTSLPAGIVSSSLTSVGVLTTLTVGSTSKTSNTILSVLAGDAYNAGVELYGSAQGTGYVYVGQSTTYGGGMYYNGDGSPAFASGEAPDTIGFYRRAASVNTEVFYYSVGSNDVFFNGTISGLLATAAQTNITSLGTLTGLTLTGQIKADYGTVALPGYAFDGDVDTGIYYYGTNTIGFACGGALAFRIDTGYCYSSNHMAPHSDSTYDLGTTSYFWRYLYADYGRCQPGAEALPTYSFATDTDTGMYRVTTDSLGFATGGTKRVTINSTGIEIHCAGSEFYNPSSHISAGTFKLLTQAQAASAFHSDSTITLTWELADFSSYVPSGVKALWVQFDVTDADGSGIVCWNDVNTTAASSVWSEQGMLMTGTTRLSRFAMVRCNTSGQFYYAQYDNATPNWDIGSVSMNVVGYWI